MKKWCKHNKNIAGAYHRCLICNPKQTLEDILNRHFFGGWEEASDFDDPNSEINHRIRHIKEAKAEIRQWIKDNMPEEKGIDYYCGEYQRTKIRGWNAYRTQALKNMGVE